MQFGEERLERGDGEWELYVSVWQATTYERLTKLDNSSLKAYNLEGLVLLKVSKAP